MSTFNINGGDGIQGGKIYGTQVIPSGFTAADLGMAYLYFSTMSPSSQQSKEYSPVAGVPNLAAPNFASVGAMIETKTSQIIEGVLNSWAKSLHEQEVRTKEWLNSLGYQLWQEVNDPIVIARNLAENPSINPLANGSGIDQQSNIASLPGEVYAQFHLPQVVQGIVWLEGIQSIMNGAAAGIQNSRTDNRNPSLNVTGASRTESGMDFAKFIVPSLMAAAVSIPLLQGVSAAASASEVETGLIVNAWNAVNPAAEALLVTQAAGWYSAMWGVGLVYSLSAQNLEKYTQGEHQSIGKDIDFAKAYAQQLVGSLNSPEFQNGLLALISVASQAAGGAVAQDPQMLLAKGKLILLAMSLALLAKLEVKSQADEGWITGEEFAGMLTGKVDYAAHDPWHLADTKALLIGQINDLLAQMDPLEKEQLLYNLISFIDSRPSVEKFLDQQNVFYAVLRPSNFEEENFDKKPIE